MASTQYAGDSWPPAVVIVQRVHVLYRLLSAVAVLTLVLVFPSGEGTECGGHCIVWIFCHLTGLVILGCFN